MKLLIPLALVGAALSVQACAPGAGATARTALDCPPSQGALMRVSAAADGRSCIYRTSDGGQVYLQLVSGDARATLQTLEAAVTAEAAAAKAATRAEAQDGGDAADTSKASEDAAAVEREVERDVIVAGGNFGVHVSDGEDGGHERAQVNLPGIHVDASDNGAKVRIAGLRINASDEGAVVSYPRDVRLKGEAFSPQKRGVRATYIYSNVEKGENYRFLGYEAGGPKTGPLTVAAVRANSRSDNDGEMYPDVEKLVRRNGGV